MWLIPRLEEFNTRYCDFTIDKTQNTLYNVSCSTTKEKRK